MRPSHPALLALTGALLVAAVACGGSISDPPKIKQVQSPLVGQWMLTTKMDTFSFETGLDTATCGMSPYCTHYRTTVAGAYLSGVLTVQDTFGLKGIVVESVQAGGPLTEAFCDSIDYKRLTGCARVSSERVVGYTGDILGPPDSTKAKSLNITIQIPDPTTTAPGRTFWARDATYARDSIYGRFA